MSIEYTPTGTVDNAMLVNVSLSVSPQQGTVTYRVTIRGEDREVISAPQPYTFDNLDGASALAAWARGVVRADMGL